MKPDSFSLDLKADIRPNCRTCLKGLRASLRRCSERSHAILGWMSASSASASIGRACGERPVSALRFKKRQRTTTAFASHAAHRGSRSADGRNEIANTAASPTQMPIISNIQFVGNRRRPADMPKRTRGRIVIRPPTGALPCKVIARATLPQA